MKVIILGTTGMAGNYVYNYFKHHAPCPVIGYKRGDFDARSLVLNGGIMDRIVPGDVVVNCVGVLKPKITSTGMSDTILINTHWPAMLADVCRECKATLIHLCSDCVFTGHDAPYSESSLCDADDLYARTKMITPEPAMVIRTSIIGEDSNMHGVGLMGWLRSALPGSNVTGYYNCIWNGITCLELAKIMLRCIVNDSMWDGVRHVYSDRSISKETLCRLISKIYNMHLNVRSERAEHISGSRPKLGGTIDRTLTTIHDRIKVSPIEQQIIEMKETKYHIPDYYESQ